MNENDVHTAQARAGVLLINLGTPSAPTARAIRRYLAQFLADRRVVELARLLWLPILYLFVLTLRPRRLVHAYRQIWTARGSPLMAISIDQAEGIRAELAKQLGREVPVALAMTYGEPSIASALGELEARNARRIVTLPLYPQYSCSTTAAAYDAVFAVLRRQRWMPELRMVNSYHDEDAYIAALAESIRMHWQAQGRGEHLLMSFHGIPQQYVRAGDPYYCQCRKTARLLADHLGLAETQYTVSFQSRFGKLPWVQPYTEPSMVQLAQNGVRTLDVICPGFAADCLETLEEVQIRYAATFTAAGGASMRYIPALNSQPLHLHALSGIVLRELRDWIPPLQTAEELVQRCRRAQDAEGSFSGSGSGG